MANIKKPGDNMGLSILQYIQSDNPADIDYGIRESIKQFCFTGLATAIGLARVSANKLHKGYGFTTMNKYLVDLTKDFKVDCSTMRRWLKIGKTFIKYKNDLEEAGYTEAHGTTKLRYLERALSDYPKDEVYENIKTMSVDDFIDYSRAKDMVNVTEKKSGIEMIGNVAYINGKRAVIIHKELDKNATRFLKKLVLIGCEAIEKDNHLVPVPLHNKREVEHFRRLLPAVLKEIRKTKGA